MSREAATQIQSFPIEKAAAVMFRYKKNHTTNGGLGQGTARDCSIHSGNTRDDADPGK